MNTDWGRHLKISVDDTRLTPEIKDYNTRWKKEIEMDVGRMPNPHEKTKEMLSTYCHYHTCDGYIQGMHSVCDLLIRSMGIKAAFWGMTKFMGAQRRYMPFFDPDAFLNFANKWERYFFIFTDGLESDAEHVMALKWGIYMFACSKTSKSEVIKLWDGIVALPPDKWCRFTAAIAAAAVVRHLKENKEIYDPCIMFTVLTFENGDQLIRRAKRMVRHMDSF